MALSQEEVETMGEAGRGVIRRVKERGTSRECLGIWECKGCGYSDRPKCVYKSQVNSEPPTCRGCNNRMVRTECRARIIRTMREDTNHPDDERFRGFVRIWHQGVHTHEPPRSHFIASDSRSQIHDLALAHPELPPAALRQGKRTNDPTHPSHRPSAPSIDGRFASAKTLGRVVNEVRPGRSNDGALDILLKLKQRHPHFVGDLCLDDGIFSMSLQREEMNNLLLEEDLSHLSGKEEIGRSGIITDAHMMYFGSNYILIQSVVFVMELARWGPVLYTVVGRDNTEAYERHFDRIFKVFSDSKLSLEDSIRRLAFVIDYSGAQLKGLKNAFIRFWVNHWENGSNKEGNLEGQALEVFETRVKGCRRHFEISVHRMCKGGKIPDGRRAEFAKLARSMMDTSSIDEANDIRRRIVALFPLSANWIKWWSAPRVLGLVATSSQKMTLATQKTVPEDTNPVEAGHKFTTVGSGGKKHTLEEGTESLRDAADLFFTEMMGAVRKFFV